MTNQVRFDDRLATILDLGKLGLPAQASAWAQIADVLAQDRGALSKDERSAALTSLIEWQPDVAFERRQSVARALANPKLPVDLATVFARDKPAVAAPVLAAVNLSDDHWLSMIPSLPPASRALLRERRGLPEAAAQLLNSYGLHDFGLGSDVAVEQVAVENVVTSPPRPTQISDLVARIEAFQRDRSRRLSPETKQPVRFEHFRFETDSDGVINWIEGVPREAIFGLSIADMAAPAGFGVDGVAAGAFRQRSEIRDSNLLIAGDGEASGKWVITAKPIFDRETGRLNGYRGAARRPNTLFGQKTDDAPLKSGSFAPDSMRQLVHELRTPLNAISGFSEMISQQLIGPVAQHYRQKAGQISAQAAKLVMIFDDLESEARFSTGTFEANSDKTADAKKAILEVVSRHEAVIDDRGVTLRMALAGDCLPVAIDTRTLERLIDRILMIIIGSAAPAEIITLRLIATEGDMSLEIDRPRALKGMSDETLLDPTHEPIERSPAAPALGIAFTLRLISKLAQVFDGRLAIGNQNFTLILPTAQDSAVKTKESS